MLFIFLGRLETHASLCSGSDVSVMMTPNMHLLSKATVPCRPLINVCDRFDMVADLTQYLYSNNMLRYIEGYVQKVNPGKAPQVVGGLLDAEAPDDFVNNLILSVRSLIPVEQLCEEVRTGREPPTPCLLPVHTRAGGREVP